MIYVTIVGEGTNALFLQRILGRLETIERRIHRAIQRQQQAGDFLLEPLPGQDSSTDHDDSDEEIDPDRHENGLRAARAEQ